MLKRFSRGIMNNFSLKLLAFLLATVLWMVVVNTEDPAVRKTMTISVSLKNQEYITDMGKYMDVLNEGNTVTFAYTTKRSVWEGISSSDFLATADMEKIEAKSNGGYRVPVNVSVNRNANQITIENKQLYLDVVLEDLGKQQFQIKPNTVGLVAEGCALGTISLDNANVVQVSGPLSVISRIESVIATVNVDGMSTDITDNVIPVFYDENGEVIDTTKLEMSVESVRISAQILNTKDVPLVLAATGTPADGYQLVKVSCEPTNVRVKGTAAVLNTLDRIQIPAAVLDLSGSTATIEKTIDISTYLEKGVFLVVSSDSKVNVKAEIEPIETKEYKVPVSNITAEGLKTGYQLSYPEQFVYLEITAGKSAHDALKVANIKGIIEVENLNEGAHIVAAEFNLEDEIYKVSPVYVDIEIKSVQNEQDNSENTENSEQTEPGNAEPGNTEASNTEASNTEAGTEVSGTQTNTTETSGDGAGNNEN